MDDQTILILCITGTVAMLAFFGIRYLFRGGDNKLRERLSSGESSKDAAPQKPAGLGQLCGRIGQAAAQPFMPKTEEKQSEMRHTLATAGLYDPSAIRMVKGFKVIFFIVGIVGGYLAGMAMDSTFLGLSLGGIVGFLAPSMWLRFKIKANQNALTFGLADALDLMVVCVEAGLTVDGAMQRVGTELAIAHPAVSREFGITHMETRVGLSRAEALKNLGRRTGNRAIQSLVSMLIQADRFGTSIANALRVHSETLRIDRQRAAEESAAKASVKMTFPLVLFIFPATFIVMIGPTVIKFMESDLMK